MNTIDAPVGLWEVFDKITEDNILYAIPFSHIEDFCKKIKCYYGVDQDGHPNMDENMWRRKRDEVFTAKVDVDSSDVDLSEYDDDDLIDELDVRGLKVLESDYTSLKVFLEEKYDINVSAYSNEELSEFLLEKIKNNK